MFFLKTQRSHCIIKENLKVFSQHRRETEKRGLTWTRTTTNLQDLSKKTRNIDCAGIDLQELTFEQKQEESGLKSVKGELLRAMENGETVVLQNIDKAKGECPALHFVVQLAIGEIREATFTPHSGGSPVQITDKDIDGFTLKATAEDRDALPPSLSYRLGRNLSITGNGNGGTSPPAKAQLS